MSCRVETSKWNLDLILHQYAFFNWAGLSGDVGRVLGSWWVNHPGIHPGHSVWLRPTQPGHPAWVDVMSTGDFFRPTLEKKLRLLSVRIFFLFFVSCTCVNRWRDAEMTGDECGVADAADRHLSLAPRHLSKGVTFDLLDALPTGKRQVWACVVCQTPP